MTTGPAAGRLGAAGTVDDLPRSTGASGGSRAVVGAVAAAFALGVLTSYGQGLLPFVLSPLANSSGSWSLVAFALAWWSARSVASAALVGALALLALLAGYVVTSELRGFPAGTGLLVFWGAAAVVVGPALGAGAWWLRSRRDVRAAFGAGSISGLLVGEGVFGLLRVADTTPASYWWGSVCLGLVLLLVGAGTRLRRAGPIVAAVLIAAATAAAFVGLYSASAGIDIGG